MRDLIRIVESEYGQPMPEPTVLYRSVSIPELVSIAFRGGVRGGGNKFSGDSRSWVFFGDELNSNLIGQGEDHTRYPSHATNGHEINLEIKRQRNDVTELGLFVQSLLMNLAGKKQWNIASAAYDDLPSGNLNTIRTLSSNYGRYDAQLGIRFKELLAAVLKVHDLENDREAIYQQSKQTFRNTRKTWEVTSAVIVTEPLSDGMLFTGEESMHDGNEYGFYPDEVRLSDLASVMLYRDGKLVATIHPDDILPTLRKMGVDTQPYLQ